MRLRTKIDFSTYSRGFQALNRVIPGVSLVALLGFAVTTTGFAPTIMWVIETLLGWVLAVWLVWFVGATWYHAHHGGLHYRE